MARCTVERLMKQLGLQGVRRGKKVRTTVPDSKAPCPHDHVSRVFRADRPDQLWVSDFTYVSTWQGWVYAVFVIDVFASHRGLEDQPQHAGQLRARCARTGFVCAPTCGQRPDSSFGSRQPIPVDSLHRTTGRSRHPASDGQAEILPRVSQPVRRVDGMIFRAFQRNTGAPQ